MTMKTLLLTLSATLAIVTTAALLGAATASGGGASTAACKAGPTTYKGVPAYRECGPASAVVKMDGRTIRYRGGSCKPTPTALALNIGLHLPGKEAKPLPRYFAVGVGRAYGFGKPARRDGTYGGATIAFVDGGKRYASMDSKVTLAGGRTRGSFTGTLFGGKAFSGTFRCS
jgi:hypothetical protein